MKNMGEPNKEMANERASKHDITHVEAKVRRVKVQEEQKIL